jgi:hypothetical protein
MSDRERIRFVLTRDEDGYPPVESELLWAEPLGNGVYRLDNIPFFVRESSLADDVETEEIAGERVFKRTMRNGGHRTVRLLACDGHDVPRLRDELRVLGCTSELNQDGRLLAVDVPPSVPSATFVHFLKTGAASGRFDYEEGAVNW